MEQNEITLNEAFEHVFLLAGQTADTYSKDRPARQEAIDSIKIVAEFYKLNIKERLTKDQYYEGS